MDKDNTQKELFNEFEAPKKLNRPNFRQLFQKADFGLTLTAEKLVFVSIGIIMLLVVFFALGVEKGKAIAASSMPIVPAQTVAVQPAVKTAPAPVAQVKTAPPTNITSKSKAAAATPVQGKTVVAPTQPAQDNFAKDKPYTIVAAAYLRQEFAVKEAASLKAAGLDSYVIKSEPYYLACVGSFVNKDSALKLLSKVRQMHRDAYVRLR